MANPNLYAPTTCTAKTSVQAIAITPTAIVSNAAASGTTVRVRSLTVANVTGSTAISLNVDLFRSSVGYRLAYAITVPANASLTPLGSDLQLYLEEGDSLRLTAGATLSLEAVCSYEVLN
ncbi:hypothetical protein UFOVP184_40 [uncultured Caudovirales phage]|uniref:Uncharacterized protein n=1 Tax=uncultured Caudovirales phage TaxID=2100421 RepID=A0A6J7WK38_9CAUD|nr:hypothetical protein UFOVP184_40 [uncultured Caudovirales phage]